MSYKVVASVDVSSSDRRPGDSISDFTIDYATPIKLKKIRNTSSGEHLHFVRLEDVRIPKSYYEITSINSTLTVVELDGAGINPLNNVATVPSGNYLISELLSVLQTELNSNTNYANTYTLDYSDITGKFSISFTGTSTSVTVLMGDSISIATQLGVTVDLVVANSTTVSGDSHINLSVVNTIKVKSTLSIGNHYRKSGVEEVLIEIPVDALRSSVITFTNHTGVRYELLSSGDINSIRFSIIDDKDRAIDFNGVNWCAKLVIYDFEHRY